MFCENCGKPLREGAKFCEYCGAKARIIPKNPVAAQPDTQMTQVAGAVIAAKTVLDAAKPAAKPAEAAPAPARQKRLYYPDPHKYDRFISFKDKMTWNQIDNTDDF